MNKKPINKSTPNFVLNPDGSHSVTVSGTIAVGATTNTWWNITDALKSRFPDNAISILFEKKRISSFKLMVSTRLDGSLTEVTSSTGTNVPSNTASARILIPNVWNELVTKTPDYKDIDEEDNNKIYVRILTNPVIKQMDYTSGTPSQVEDLLPLVIGVQITTDYIGDLGICPTNLPFKEDNDKQELKINTYQLAMEKALSSMAEHKIISKMNDNLAKIEMLNRNYPKPKNLRK